MKIFLGNQNLRLNGFYSPFIKFEHLCMLNHRYKQDLIVLELDMFLHI